MTPKEEYDALHDLLISTGPDILGTILFVRLSKLKADLGSLGGPGGIVSIMGGQSLGGSGQVLISGGQGNGPVWSSPNTGNVNNGSTFISIPLIVLTGGTSVHAPRSSVYYGEFI